MARLIDPGAKILRHPDVLARMRRGERVWPLHVEVDCSARCNLACPHCDFAHVHDGSILPLPLARSLLSELVGRGTRAVTFSGGGEPTRNPDFPEIVTHAATGGLQVGLYTNGTNPSAYTQVLPWFSWVYVSLDAAGPDDWAARKMPRNPAVGHSLFWEVLEGISAALAYRERGEPTIGVGFLLDSANWRDAPAMAALARSLGVDYCQLRPIVAESADYGWVAEALPTLQALEGTRTYVSLDRFRELLYGSPRAYTVCRGSELVPCVTADGSVWVCPNTRGLRWLGDLKHETFAAIWARRPEQRVGPDCRVACRNHALATTLEYVCGTGPHDGFV